jgi:hypothetical protein
VLTCHFCQFIPRLNMTTLTLFDKRTSLTEGTFFLVETVISDSSLGQCEELA